MKMGSQHGNGSRRVTQRARILGLLLKSRGAWVPSWRLGRIALQYCSRIAEIRSAGYRVENHVEYRNGQQHGAYRIATPKSRGGSR